MRVWGGPLDVEGLAIDAVREVAEAAAALDAGRSITTTPQRSVAAFTSGVRLRIDGREPVGFSPASGYFRTRDGWIRTHANYPHHAAAVRTAFGIADGTEGPDLAAAVAEALLALDAVDAEAALQGAGSAAARLRTRDEWLASPEGAAAEGGEWIEYSPAADEQPGPRAGAGLTGLRVLSLTRVIAGPTAARTLAVLGADVHRIDPPHLPELEDQALEGDMGVTVHAVDLNERLAEIRELAARADVLLTGYRPGALERFGIRAPVEVSLAAWGWDGPWAGLRGFDSVVQSACGIGHLYGREGADGVWRPGALPVQALDYASGYGMAAAALRLHARGGGQARISLARTAAELFRRPVAGGPVKRLHVPMRRTDSPLGEISYVSPPFVVDGRPADYPFVPGRDGPLPEWPAGTSNGS